MTPRKEFSKAVKVQRFEHCGGTCEMCGCNLRPGQFDYHHAREAVLDGENAFENCRVLCKTCHKTQTRTRAPVLAKTRRIREKHIGATKPQGRPMLGTKRSGISKGIGGIVRDRKTGEPVHVEGRE